MSVWASSRLMHSSRLASAELGGALCGVAAGAGATWAFTGALAQAAHARERNNAAVRPKVTIDGSIHRRTGNAPLQIRAFPARLQITVHRQRDRTVEGRPDGSE